LTGVFRFGILPLFLFSGTFFPISQLPAALEWTARATPLWHGVTLCRELAAGTVELWPALGHAAYLSAFTVTGAVIAVRILQRRLLQ
jgi:lipooligosaccharide transport system permease protein